MEINGIIWSLHSYCNLNYTFQKLLAAKLSVMKLSWIFFKIIKNTKKCFFSGISACKYVWKANYKSGRKNVVCLVEAECLVFVLIPGFDWANLPPMSTQAKHWHQEELWFIMKLLYLAMRLTCHGEKNRFLPLSESDVGCVPWIKHTHGLSNIVLQKLPSHLYMGILLSCCWHFTNHDVQKQDGNKVLLVGDILIQLWHCIAPTEMFAEANCFSSHSSWLNNESTENWIMSLSGTPQTYIYDRERTTDSWNLQT